MLDVFLESDFLIGLAGVLFGVATTWIAAKYYYLRASYELIKEANELRRLNVLMLRGLEASGMATFSRDTEGNLKGLVITGSGTHQAEPATTSGSGTVTPNK